MLNTSIVALITTAIMLALVGMGVGCRRSVSPPTFIHSPVKSISLSSRQRSTGEFKDFEITDSAAIKSIQDAVNKDLLCRDPNYDCGMGISDDHELVFCCADGTKADYTILGDNFITSNGVRYLAHNTMAAINDSHAKGWAVPVVSAATKPTITAASKIPQEDN